MDKGAPPPYSPPIVGTSSGYVSSPGFVPTHGYPPLQQQQTGFVSPQPQPHQPPPPGPIISQYQYQHQPHESRVIITNGPVIFRSFGPDSQLTTCPYCHQLVTTKVVTEASSKTHLFALILCLFACWPCCLLPYCMESCQSKQHYCPHCKAYLGTYDE